MRERGNRNDSSVPSALAHKWTELSDVERRILARRLRLVWASGGDVAHAQGVERMINDASRAQRRRYGRAAA